MVMDEQALRNIVSQVIVVDDSACEDGGSPRVALRERGYLHHVDSTHGSMRDAERYASRLRADLVQAMQDAAACISGQPKPARTRSRPMMPRALQAVFAAIPEALSETAAPPTVAEVAAQAGMSVSVTRGHLMQLVKLGYISETVVSDLTQTS